MRRANSNAPGLVHLATCRCRWASALVIAGCRPAAPRDESAQPPASTQSSVATADAASAKPASPNLPPPPPEMVRIEGGTLRGVTLATFDLDRTEVTAEAYARCVDAGACRLPFCGDERLCTTGDCPSLDDCSPYATWGHAERGKQPIVGVDFDDAATYCRFVGKRLPSPREWQWAAQGRDEARKYPWGNEVPTAESACWHRTGGGLCAVGTVGKDTSRDGVRDLAGNASEWTAFAAEPWGILGDRDDLRFACGGSWGELHANALASAFRIAVAMAEAADDLGFRCAAEVSPTTEPGPL